ncbi:cycloeucalenol cycloisomerase [Acrasis kona]|uniref:Cycloeucalenol cycloisomerase n=1 Tax=Acrasis kona TaxID=1008807 RepID=A0AAW2ZHR6_9EUKA
MTTFFFESKNPSKYVQQVSSHNTHKNATRLEWTLYGLPLFVPCFLYPLLFPGQADKHLPITKRYWFKANIWIGILNFVGNYFWTHYFYNLLGADYTMDTYRINNVPYLMFFCTQAYFTMYHSLTNYAQRIFYYYFPKNTWTRFFLLCVLIFVMSWVTAFMETFTIQNFPYYTHKNKSLMYTVGSVVYAIYFIVSFPMYLRVDENIAEDWSISKVSIDALGGCMLVTILLDFWRLYIGGIVESNNFVVIGK